MTDNPPAVTVPVVSSVSRKMLTFWLLNRDPWFLHAEAQFALRNITVSDTKYYYVVAALDSEISIHVPTLLNSQSNLRLPQPPWHNRLTQKGA